MDAVILIVLELARLAHSFVASLRQILAVFQIRLGLHPNAQVLRIRNYLIFFKKCFWIFRSATFSFMVSFY